MAVEDWTIGGTGYDTKNSTLFRTIREGCVEAIEVGLFIVHCLHIRLIDSPGNKDGSIC